MILSDDSKVGVFIPFKYLYFILTQLNKSRYLFFFFSFIKFPVDVCFNEDPILQIPMFVLRKPPAAGNVLHPALTPKNESRLDNGTWHRAFGCGASMHQWYMPCA